MSKQVAPYVCTAVHFRFPGLRGVRQRYVYRRCAMCWFAAGMVPGKDRNQLYVDLLYSCQWAMKCN